MRNPRLVSHAIVAAAGAVIAGAVLTSRAQAQSPGAEVTPAAGDPWSLCRHETDDRRRLSCYDREYDRRESLAAQNAPAGKHSAPPPPVAPAQPVGPGTAVAALAPAPGASLPPSAPAVAKPRASAQRYPLFHATVTEMHFRGAGEFVITLDNGQVWTQYTVEGKPQIAVGDRVTIRPGWLGTYVLSGPTAWITKVHPVEDG